MMFRMSQELRNRRNFFKKIGGYSLLGYLLGREFIKEVVA